MEQTKIEDMEEWLVWKKRIIDAGFMLWQAQYQWNDPHGFIVGFMDPNGERFEIVTHSRKVAEDIERSGLSGI